MNFSLRRISGFPRDGVGVICCWLSIIIALSGLCMIIFTTINKGLPDFTINFLVDDPSDAGRSGGIGPIIVSTIIILFISLIVAVPMGISTALLLSEAQNRFPFLVRIISISLDILAGVPSIVFGLFGSIFFAQYMGMGVSLYSGGFTLAFMILPYFIRIVEQGLAAIPNEVRLGIACLTLSRTIAVFGILLPMIVPSIILGIVLSLARAASETAALLFTSGYIDRMPSSLSDSGRTLSVHIYDLAMNVAGGDSASYRSALVLLAFLFFIFQVSHFLSRWYSSKFTGGNSGNFMAYG